MSQFQQSPPPFYLCAGFHRSGTSMLAQSLANSGVHMGDELMGASFSNPLGHVEDMPVVRLHDKIFEINGSDWRFYGKSPLVKPHWFKNYLKRYIDERTFNDELCGVKDPRACFFLNNWQVAGEERMRYVLVYRHWSTAANSLLNRASRHLINGTADISVNKVNVSFWQQPTLAFEMWKAANEEIVSFYQKHPDKCVLISQEAYVRHEAEFTLPAQKIGLPQDVFDTAVVEEGLISSTVPSSVLSMLDEEFIAQLDETWHKLQTLADVQSPEVPKVVDSSQMVGKVNWLPDNTQAKYESVADIATFKGFDISTLSWQESLGFLARIPEENIYERLFDDLMQRSFTHPENYDTLAKIAHKNKDFITTKLAKMRAMQIECKSWSPQDWTIYTEDQKDWLHLDDGSLPKANPYSLLPNEKSPLSAKDRAHIVSLNVEQVVKALQSKDNPKGRHWLSSVLLHKAFVKDDYRTLASVSAKKGWGSLREYCLFKALRFCIQSDLIMEFGDLYLSHGMTINAFQCFEAALSLTPDSPALLCRLGDTLLEMGDINKASEYMRQAKEKSPAHPAVIRCNRRLDRLLAEKASAAENAKSDIIESKRYVMPLVESYEDVLDVLRVDEKAGDELDLYNMRMSFVIRDNKAWLSKGVSLLENKTGNCLAEKVVRHWSKLWPSAVLSTELGLSFQNDALSSTAVSEKVTENQSALGKLLVTVNVDDVLKVSEVLAFVEQIPCKVYLHFICSELDEVEIAKAIRKESYLDIQFSRSDLLVDKLLDCDLVCRLSTSPKGIVDSPTNILLQQLFALLGSQSSIDKILQAFAKDKSLGVVFASYHPDLLEQVVWGEDNEEVQGIAKALPLDIPESLSLFPLGGMYWARPEAMVSVVNEDLSKVTEAALLKLLPSLIKQKGYKTLPAHLVA